MSLRVMVLALMSTSAFALTPVNLCVSIRVARTSAAAHAIYATQYFQSEYANLNVNWKLVGAWEPSGTTIRNSVRAFAANGTDCDIVIGPGSSGIVQGLNPIINSMWLDFSATATSLSDRAEYVLFSRVVPTDTDATAGIGYFMNELQWTSVFVVCADNAYGQSVTAGVSQAVTRAGGGIISADCVLPNAGYDTLVRKLNDAAASPTKIIFAAMSTTDVLYTPFIQAVLDTKIYQTHVLLFSESSCSSLPFRWSVVPGSFCATFATDQTLFAPFYSAYLNADRSNILAAYATLGWPASQVDLVTTAAYPAMAADAARLALRAYSSYVAAFNAPPTSATVAVAWLRNQTMTGFSGDIAFPTGDRAVANMVVYNAGLSPTGGNTTVTNIVANTTAKGNVSLASLLYCIGKYRTRADIPTALSDAAGSNFFTTIGPSVIVPCGVVILLALILICRRGRSVRDVSAAPKDPNAEFTIAFTDIQASTSLWARAPEAMGVAVDLHHALMRTLISEYKGYEVKTIGDSFMVAFKSALDALRFAEAAQIAFYEATWPPGIDAVYKELTMETSGAMPSEPVYQQLWNGIRVRIGVHTGVGEIKFDEVAQSYDYYGTVVNTAARVESVGLGGMILITDITAAAVRHTPGGPQYLNTVNTTMLGPQPLRGLEQPINLCNVQPMKLSARQHEYGPLRLDREHTGNDSESDLSDSLGPRSSAGSFTYDSDDSSPQRVIKNASRRLHGISESLLTDEFVVIKALLSTTGIEERLKVVGKMAQRWRVDTNKVVTGTKENQCDVIIAKLAVKVLPVAVALRRLKDVLERGGSMHSSRDAAQPWASPRPHPAGTKSSPGFGDLTSPTRTELYPVVPSPVHAAETSDGGNVLSVEELHE